MKTNEIMFWVIAVYFTVVGTAYFIWNNIDSFWYMNEWRNAEWSGGVPLLGSAGLSGMIAFYLGLVRKNQGGTLHEDLDDADIDDGDPEVGEFSPWSWWPIALAGAASLFILGLTLNGNFFLTFFAIPMIIVAVVGWTYEYYRGYFAR